MEVCVFVGNAEKPGVFTTLAKKNCVYMPNSNKLPQKIRRKKYILGVYQKLRKGYVAFKIVLNGWIKLMGTVLRAHTMGLKRN